MEQDRGKIKEIMFSIVSPELFLRNVCEMFSGTIWVDGLYNGLRFRNQVSA